MKKQGSRERVYLGASGWQAVDRAERSGSGRPVGLWALLLVVGAALLAIVLPGQDHAPVTSEAPPAQAAGWGSSPFGSGPATTSSAAAEVAPALEPNVQKAAADAAPMSAWEADFDAARARFHDLRWFSEETALVVEQAKQADAVLPRLLASGRVRPGEALLLKADLLEVLEPDEPRRTEAFARWWTEHPLARPPASSGDPRAAEKLHRERALVLEWHSQPSVDRELPDLEDQLNALWATGR